MDYGVKVKVKVKSPLKTGPLGTGRHFWTPCRYKLNIYYKSLAARGLDISSTAPSHYQGKGNTRPLQLRLYWSTLPPHLHSLAVQKPLLTSTIAPYFVPALSKRQGQVLARTFSKDLPTSSTFVATGAKVYIQPHLPPPAIENLSRM